MHTVIGKIIKYILRVLLILILGLLLVGLIKYRGDVGAYVNSLNTRDRRQARDELSLAHPSSFAHMFWGTGDGMGTGDLSLLSGELLTGNLLTGTESTGLNAYDPNLEYDLNTITGNTVAESGMGGFKSPEAEVPPSDSDQTSKEQLLNLIRQRELKK